MKDLNEILQILDETNAKPNVRVEAEKKIKAYVVSFFNDPGALEMFMEEDTADDDVGLSDEEMKVFGEVSEKVRKQVYQILKNNLK